MKKAFVLGSINLDIVIQVKEFPKTGETVFGNGVIKNPGGKGANQAVAIANQGIDTWMIGCLGNDAEGEILRETLQKKQIHDDFVEQVEGVPSGVAYITIDRNDNQIIVIPGANHALTKAMVDLALKKAEKTDVFVTQMEVEPAVVFYGLKEAKRKGMTTLLNPSPIDRSFDKDILEWVDYLVLNEIETEILTSLVPDSDEHIYHACRRLISEGVKHPIITLGALGAATLLQEKILRVPSRAEKVVDTTAAGDTFLGVFTASLMEGADIETAMTQGNRAAGITVSRIGAQNSIPTKAELI